MRFFETRMKSLFSDSKKQSMQCPNVLTIPPTANRNIMNDPAI